MQLSLFFISGYYCLFTKLFRDFSKRVVLAPDIFVQVAEDAVHLCVVCVVFRIGFKAIANSNPFDRFVEALDRELQRALDRFVLPGTKHRGIEQSSRVRVLETPIDESNRARSVALEGARHGGQDRDDARLVALAGDAQRIAERQRRAGERGGGCADNPK